MPPRSRLLPAIVCAVTGVLGGWVGSAAPATSAAAADTVTTGETTARELARGVYTIRHADPTADFPDGNTTVIVGSRAVLVVDSGYLPSTARADIARIRGWTERPVRYLLNTHWHNDHVSGNQAYRQAWPGVEIVAHEETRRMIEGRIASYLRRFAAAASPFDRQREAWRRTARDGVDGDGKAVSPEQRRAAADALRRAEAAAMEFSEATVVPPSLTFEHQLRIDLGDRIVELRHAGRGNTGGDVVAWLPAERILVAGDLVAHPVPYAFGGYPAEWAATLRRLAELGPELIVPGHGDVQRGTGYLRRVADLVDSVRAQITAQLDQRGSAFTVDEALKTIDLAAAKREFAGDDADNQAFFDAAIASLIRIAYAEARQR